MEVKIFPGRRKAIWVHGCFWHQHPGCKRAKSCMTDKGKYCCFNCPKGDFEEKRLQDECPTCGQPYGFPLVDHPAEIGEFKIIKPLGRCFYAATYVAESQGLEAFEVSRDPPGQAVIEPDDAVLGHGHDDRELHPGSNCPESQTAIGALM